MMPSPYGSRPKPSGGFELAAWLFMRVSGILLLGLALGHLAIMHLVNNVDVIDFQFVSKRYAGPFWRIYDLFLLLLALTHGMNGLRTVVDDFIQRPPLRVGIQMALYTLGFVLLILGSFTILTFRPEQFVNAAAGVP